MFKDLSTKTLMETARACHIIWTEVSKHCSQNPVPLLPKALSTPKSYSLHILQLSIFAILEIKAENFLNEIFNLIFKNLLAFL